MLELGSGLGLEFPLCLRTEGARIRPQPDLRIRVQVSRRASAAARAAAACVAPCRLRRLDIAHVHVRGGKRAQRMQRIGQR